MLKKELQKENRKIKHNNMILRVKNKFQERYAHVMMLLACGSLLLMFSNMVKQYMVLKMMLTSFSIICIAIAGTNTVKFANYSFKNKKQLKEK